MVNLATLNPPWTSETAPRNGGRPKGLRDKIDTRVAEAMRAFLEGDENHPAVDLVGWLHELRASPESADRATLARFMGLFVRKDIKLETSGSPLVLQVITGTPAELGEPGSVSAQPAVIDVPAREIGNGAEQHK